ncbi:RHS repeat-associated protein [Allocatelliglobosispora scoriae]|uniref:RHS repeat-associated protein n=1 Tax=Allocatelliglobosispora scoriae TaxID=643052 RepID=A0A841BIJ8_9ACTN|nr:RHS repeat-associated core domain-containing protein [Allocatelliglobosispora scoriae]MBB5866640.1 RHS repeat-associated protein [Allocatelliglobosispora scoriae]
MWANADGSRSVEQAAVPVRAQRPDGSWADIDLTLHSTADGSIAPLMRSGDLRFSGAQPAGEHVLAATGKGTERLAMLYTGALPAPSLDGSRATYADVRPGLDLVLEATRAGFEQLFIAHDRAALAHVAVVTLPVVGTGIASHKLRADGVTEFRNAAGKVFATVPPARMWDAETDVRGMPRHEKDVATNTVKRPVGKRSGSSGERMAGNGGVALTLQPDAAWLADSARKFPITIDPSLTTMSPTTDLYWVEGSSTAHTGDNNLQMGYLSTDAKRRRTGFAWPTSSISHAFIQSATLSVYNYWSGACARAAWEVWRLTGTFGTTWATMPTWSSLETSTTVTRGYSASCGDGADAYTTLNVTSLFQKAANAGDATTYIGLKAANETVADAWKQFRSNEWTYSSAWPYVNITYWPLSTVSATGTNPATTCTTTGTLPRVNTLTPTLAATISNPLGGSMYGRFEVQTADGATTVIPTVSTPQVTSGATVNYAVPAGKLANGTSYRWHAAADDNHTWSGNGQTPQAWSPWCAFTVDTTPPSSVSISSSSHASTSSWYAASTFAGTASAADAISATAGYSVAWDTSPTTLPSATVTQTSPTLSKTGLTNGVHYVHVRACDTAGNWSTTAAHFAVNVDTAAPGAPGSLASSTHPISTQWYSTRTVTSTWTAPADTSGIGAYAATVDQSATTLPPSTGSGSTVLPATIRTFTTTTSADGVWYIHVRAKDNAGTWATSAAHLKVQIDTASLLGPTITSSSHPDQTAAYQATGFSAAWTPPGGTIAGYSLVVDQIPGTVPDTTVDQTATAYSAAYAEGTWYLHVRAKTSAGTWSSTSTFRFTVDTTTPAAPSVSSDTITANGWSGGEGETGTFTAGPGPSTDVVKYLYGLDAEPSGTPVDVSQGQPGTITIGQLTAGEHTLKVLSVDAAGHWSTATSYRFAIGSPGSVTSPATATDSAGRTLVKVSGHEATTGLTLQWRRADADAWQTVPTGYVQHDTGGTAIGSWPVTTTGGGSYPTLVWNIAATVNAAETGSDPVDGPVQIRGLFTTAAGNTGGSPGVSFTLDQAMGGAAAQTVGPVDVNLLTGNATVGAADVSVVGLGVARSFNTRKPNLSDGTGMFGPGWTSGFGAMSAPYTDLIRNGSLVTLTLPDATTFAFTEQADGTGFTPQLGYESVALSYNSAANSYTLTDKSTAVTVFQRQSTDPADTWYPYVVTPAGSKDTITYSWQKTTVDAAVVVRPTRLLGPIPGNATCDSTLTAASNRGCRAIWFTYAATTTASGTGEMTWGDYNGRVKAVSFTGWNPDTSAMTTIEIAHYLYDNTGRLRAVFDPRVDHDGGQHLATKYAYDSDGIVNQITPPAQEPWNLGYTTLPGDAGKGRLATVSRSALSAGTATSTIVYRVPTTGSGAPYDLSYAQTVRWAQETPPVTATAIYPPTQLPNGSQAGGTLPASYERATIIYLDADGRQVNTAEPGGGISTTWYSEQWGAVSAELTAANRQAALDYSETDDADHEYWQAIFRQTIYEYAEHAPLVVWTITPRHWILLTNGTLVYDNVRTYHWYNNEQESKATTAVMRWDSSGYNEYDARTTTTDYDWSLKQPITEVVDPDGLALTTRYAYDSTGRRIAQTNPAGAGSDATPSTRFTVYYSAIDNETHPQCGGHAEWDGLVCLTKAGGQPASGAELPITTSTYNLYGAPTTIVESTSAGILRTTTITYDSAGRAIDSTSLAPGLGEPLQRRRTVYDASSGQAVRSQTVDAAGTVTAQIVRLFDTLGRQTSYVDADGNTSTVTYDLASREAVTNDGLATRTYTYDGGSERRGLPTRVVDSLAGTFTATYNLDGIPDTQTWPNGTSVQTSYNEVGDPVEITYDLPGCGRSNCTLYAESAQPGVHGEWITRSSSLSNQEYAYDNAGRLTQVKDTVSGQCTVRAHVYDRASNRTSVTAYSPGAGGACQTTTTAGAKNWSYDTADRVISSSYTYDDLGRTSTMPGSDTAVPGGGTTTMTYYANDMVRTINQGSRTTTYTLDVVANRVRFWTDNATGTSLTKVNHYVEDGDSPTWTNEGGGTITRMMDGLAGVVGTQSSSTSRTWMLSSLRGDLVAGIGEGDTGLTYTTEYDETGKPRNSADAGSRRYGWLGSTQRAADTPGGLMLMGARLYAPGSGRFLSTDPISGGSANPYEYCSGDAVGCTDTAGTMSCKASKSLRNHTVKVRGVTIRKWRSYTFTFRCDFTHKEMTYLFNYFTGIFVTALAGALGAVIGGVACSAGTLIASVICGAIFGFLFALVGGLAASGISAWYDANCTRDHGARRAVNVKYHLNTWPWVGTTRGPWIDRKGSTCL